jgi:hypothetical protein
MTRPARLLQYFLCFFVCASSSWSESGRGILLGNGGPPCDDLTPPSHPCVGLAGSQSVGAFGEGRFSVGVGRSVNAQRASILIVLRRWTGLLPALDLVAVGSILLPPLRRRYSTVNAVGKRNKESRNARRGRRSGRRPGDSSQDHQASAPSDRTAIVSFLGHRVTARYRIDHGWARCLIITVRRPDQDYITLK